MAGAVPARRAPGHAVEVATLPRSHEGTKPTDSSCSSCLRVFVVRYRYDPSCARCWSKTTPRLPTSSSAACARRASRSITPPTATPGSTAALEQPYDVAIVDLMLPKRDGLVADRRAAPARRRDAGADPERPALGGRPRPRPAGGRRRLPDQAVRVRRAAGARAGAGPPRHARAGADDADRRRSGAGSAVAQGDARRQADRPAAARVRAARIS